MTSWIMICPGVYEGVPDGAESIFPLGNGDADAAGQDGDGDDTRVVRQGTGWAGSYVYPRRVERVYVSHADMGEA